MPNEEGTLVILSEVPRSGKESKDRRLFFIANRRCRDLP
jgi:hypothetical protein